MTAALVADERAYQAFVDPKRFRRRARTVRVELDAEKAAAAYFGETQDAGEQVPPDGATTAAAVSPACSVPAGGVTPPPPAGRPGHPCSLCGAAPARFYPMGWRCAECGPPALPEVDPERTAEALAARRVRLLRAGRLFTRPGDA